MLKVPTNILMTDTDSVKKIVVDFLKDMLLFSSDELSQ